MKSIGLGIVVLVLGTCLAISCQHRDVPENQPAEVHTAETTVHPIDAAFEASHAEPDGSTASMLAYAQDYRAVWKAEAQRLAEALSVTAELAEFDAALEVRAQEELEAYKQDEDAPYGSIAAASVMMMEAEAYREWALSVSPDKP